MLNDDDLRVLAGAPVKPYDRANVLDAVPEMAAELLKLRQILKAPCTALFADRRPPTTNERYLLNLLSWRSKEASQAGEEIERLRGEADIARGLVLSLLERLDLEEDARGLGEGTRQAVQALRQALTKQEGGGG